MMAWLPILISAFSFAAVGYRYKFMQVNLIDSAQWASYPVSWILPNVFAGALAGACLYLILLKAYEWGFERPPERLGLYVSGLFAPFALYWIVPDLFARAHSPVLGFLCLAAFLISWTVFFFRDPRWWVRLQSEWFLDPLGLFVFNWIIWFRLLGTQLGDIVGFMFGQDAGALAKYYQFPAWNPEMYAGGMPYFYSYFHNSFIIWLFGFGPVSPANAEMFRIWAYRLPYLTLICASSAGMYFVIRRAFGLSRLAAVFTGVTFTMNFYMERVSGAETLHMLPYMAFPWAFWLLVEGFDRLNLKWIAGAGLVMGAVWGLFFVHPENFYCLYMAIAAFCALRIFYPADGQSRLFAGLALVLFFEAHAAFSYFFFPYAEFITVFKSSLGHFDPGRLKWGFRDYLPFVHPFFTGWTGAIFAIFMILGFDAFKAGFLRDRRRFLFLFSIWTYVFFAIAHFGPTPLNAILGASPTVPFPYVHFWHRSAPVVYFFQYILCAMGLDFLLKLFREGTVAKSWIYGRLALAAGILGALIFLGPDLVQYLPQTVYHFNDNVAAEISGRRHFEYNTAYLVMAIVSLVSFCLSRVDAKRKTVHLICFFALVLTPLMHFMDQRLGFFDRASLPEYSEIIENAFGPGAKLPEAWPYLRRSPEDRVARDYAAQFGAADQEFVALADAGMRAWLKESGKEFYGPYLTGEPFARYVEAGLPENNPGVTFEFKRSPFFNSAFSLAGNVGRPHLWRWFADFDRFYPWVPSVDATSKVPIEYLREYRPALDMLGVKYIAVNGPEYDSAKGRGTFDGMTLRERVTTKAGVNYAWIENSRALPMIRLVGQCKLNAFGGMRISALRYLNEVLMSDCPAGEGQPGPELPAVRIRDVRGNIAAGSIEGLKRGAYVFMSQMYHPDWRLLTDGKPAEIEKANLGFIGAAVPAGTEKLWFEFRSGSLWLGIFVSLLTVLAFLTWAHYGRSTFPVIGLRLPKVTLSEKQRRLARWLPAGLSILFMIYRAYALRDVPFQGEHWELIDDFTKADGIWAKLDVGAFFVCFGHIRFQPLAFVIPLISYILFGHFYFAHYLVSLTLFTATVYYAMQLYQLVTTGKKDRFAFLNYPLETAFLLVSYVASDVLSWTFFHYIQLATLFSVMAVYWILTDLDVRRSWRRWAAVAMLVSNMLTYEAYVAVITLVIFVLLLKTWLEKKTFWWEIAVLFSSFGVIVYNLLETDAKHIALSETTYWLLPYAATLPGYLLYTLTLYGLVALFNLFWVVPLGNWLGYHFAMLMLPPEWWSPLIMVGVWVPLIGIPWMIWKSLRTAFRERRIRADGGVGFALGVLAGLGVALAVIYGRRESVYYSVFQYRYVYSALPFLALAFFAFLKKGPAKLRVFLLVAGIYVSLTNSLTHLDGIRYIMQPLTAYVKELKAQDLTRAQIVEKVMEKRNQRTLKGIAPGAEEFLYNGTKCHHF